jgi:hypothetical protein
MPCTHETTRMQRRRSANCRSAAWTGNRGRVRSAAARRRASITCEMIRPSRWMCTRRSASCTPCVRLHSVCAPCAPCPHPAAVCAGVRERLDSMMCSMRTLQRGSRTASDLWAQQRRLRARTGMTQPVLSLRSARHRTRLDFLSQSKSAEGLPAVRGPRLIRTGSLPRQGYEPHPRKPLEVRPRGTRT